MQKPKLLAFDIEALGLLSWTMDRKTPVPPASKVWCLAIQDVNTKEEWFFGPDKIAKGVELLRTATVLIGHNIVQYDLPVLERLYGKINVKAYDTLIASQLIYGPPQSHKFPLRKRNGQPSLSLEAWGVKLKFPKQEFNDWTAFTPKMKEYCINDVRLTTRVFHVVNPLIKARNLGPAMKLEHDTARICAEMTCMGFPFDVTHALDLQKTLSIRHAEITDELCRSFPPITHERVSEKTGKPLKPRIETFNPGSRLMIASRLKSKYGWIAPTTEKGNPSVDEEVLSQLDFPEAKLLVEAFDVQKKLGYLDAWLSRVEASNDGRLHPTFNTLRAATSRMSSSDPNIQQIDKDPAMRRLFIPIKGMKMIGCDAKGLEGRMAAHAAYPFDNGVFRDKLLHGDMHTETWKLFPKWVADRNTAKTLFYGGLLYSAGDRRTGEIVGQHCKCPARPCHPGCRCAAVGAFIKAKYFAANPQIKQMNEAAQQELESSGSVELIDGRRVAPPFVFDAKRERWRKPTHKALNYKLQGNGAIVMKKALCLAHERLSAKFPRNKWQLFAIVHDEIQGCAAPDIATEAAEILRQSIADAGDILGFTCPLDGDPKIGDNWSETH